METQGPKLGGNFLQRVLAFDSEGVVWEAVDQGSLRLLSQNQAQRRDLRCSSDTLPCAFTRRLLVRGCCWHLTMGALALNVCLLPPVLV